MSGDMFLSKYVYELYGFLNMFGVIPDFVYPVFLHRGELYLQSGKRDLIDEFIKLRDSAKKYVININKICLEYLEQDIWKRGIVNSERVISRNINEKALYGFQLSEEKIVCGESKYMLCFLAQQYVTHDPVLKKEISDFQKEFKRYGGNTNIAGKRQKRVGRVKHREDKHDMPRIRLWISPGTGRFIINGKTVDCYFQENSLKAIVWSPLTTRKLVRRYNIKVTVSGGTPRGQAWAIKRTLENALKKMGTSYRRWVKKSKEIPESKSGNIAARRAPIYLNDSFYSGK